jgi:hypothetical protein
MEWRIYAGINGSLIINDDATVIVNSHGSITVNDDTTTVTIKYDGLTTTVINGITTTELNVFTTKLIANDGSRIDAKLYPLTRLVNPSLS